MTSSRSMNIEGMVQVMFYNTHHSYCSNRTSRSQVKNIPHPACRLCTYHSVTVLWMTDVLTLGSTLHSGCLCCPHQATTVSFDECTLHLIRRVVSNIAGRLHMYSITHTQLYASKFEIQLHQYIVKAKIVVSPYILT